MNWKCVPAPFSAADLIHKAVKQRDTLADLCYLR